MPAPHLSGRPFLQIPGPTNVPDRILRAMDRPVIDHRSPEFGQMVKALLPDVAKVFKSEQGKVVLYPASGTGAWEASLVNTLAPATACSSSTTAISPPSSPRLPAIWALTWTRFRCA